MIGLASDRCRVASVKKSRTIEASETKIDLSLALAQLAAKACYLTVSPTGSGTITSTPPGISCSVSTPDTCSFGFDANTTVKLVSVPADPIKTYTRWPAACKVPNGATSCTISIFEETRLNVAFDTRICTPGSACWYQPLPTGVPLYGVWASGPKDVWAVGASGVILH